MNEGARRRGAGIRVLLLALTILPLVVPLYRQYWIQNHEGYSYALRAEEVVRCWRDGFWSAHWFPDLYYGQGYPFLCFYAPLSIVTAAAFTWAGVHVLLGLKLTMTLAALLGAFGAYRLARRGVSPTSAFVASVLYSYAPYHVSNFCVRGDIAEYLGMGFLPWCLEAVLALREDRSARRIAALGAFGAAAILSHNLIGLFTGLMMAGAGAWVVAESKERLSTALAAAAGGALALGLAAFFWIPAMTDQRWVKTYKMLDGAYAVAANFPPFASLLGLGTRPATTSGMQVWLGLGWAAVPLLLAGLVFARRFPRQAVPLLGVGAMLLLSGVFLSAPVSFPLYERFQILRFVQFPWRFHALISLGAAVLAAAGFEVSFARLRWPLALVAAAVASLAAYWTVRGEIVPYDSLPVFPELLSVERMRTQFATTTGRNEYMPKWVTKARTAPPDFENGVQAVGDATVRNVERRVGRYDFDVEALTPVVIDLQDLYYPGWAVERDGRSVAVRPAAQTGNLEFDLPAGTSKVQARLHLTTLRRATALVSGLLALLSLWWLRPKRRAAAS